MKNFIPCKIWEPSWS